MRERAIGVVHSTRVLGTALGLMAITVGPAKAQAHAAALPVATSHGTSGYTILPDSSDNIRTAIDRTVARMSFITRPIARSRLNKVNPMPHRVRFALGADSVSVAFDDGNPVITPLNGHTVPWSNPLTHETDQAHVLVSGDTIRQTIAAPDGERENALVFSGDSATLHLQVTVRSHRLPRPLVYLLVFRRG